MNTIEALKLASLALINTGTEYKSVQWELELQALDAINTALAAPVAAEPVRVIIVDDTPCNAVEITCGRSFYWGRTDDGSIFIHRSEHLVREPLTWKQFVRAFAAEYPEDEDIAELLNAPEPERAEALRVVRMIERFHGITKEGAAK